MEQAKHFLTQFTGPESYLIFYFLLAGCGMGMPFNSDFVIITASVLAALGYFKLSLLIPIAFFGLLTGDTVNFFVARTYGKKILKRAPFSWILKPEKVTEAEKFIQRKGKAFVFFIRFLPFIRTVLYFTAGTLHVKPRAFYLLDGISTLIYLFILMNAAYYAGENIDTLIGTLKHFQIILLSCLGLGTILIFIRKKLKRPLLT